MVMMRDLGEKNPLYMWSPWEGLCDVVYIFLKTDAGAANALLYKATFIPSGYGISPKVAWAYAGLSVH